MNPYVAYKKQSISTLTPIEVIIKLYDECEKQLHLSINFINEKNYEKAHNAIDFSIELVSALRSVLDMSVGEISKNLDSLYEYFHKQLIVADMKKDKKIIEDLIPQISELRSAFFEISKMPKVPSQGVKRNVMDMEVEG